MVDPATPNRPASAEEVANAQAIENLQGGLERLLEFAKVVMKNFEKFYDTKNKFEKSLNSVEKKIAKIDLNYLTLYNMQVALSEKVDKLEKAAVNNNGIGNMHQFVKDLEDAEKEISSAAVIVRTFVDNLVNKLEEKFDAIDKSLSEMKVLHIDLSLKVETLEKGMKNLHLNQNEKDGDAERFKPQSLEKEKPKSDRRLRKKARSVVATKRKAEVEVNCKDEASAETATETWDSDQEWEVEKILDKRTLDNGLVEYFLKWKGWQDKFNSWEVGKKLNCPRLLEEFEYKLKNVTKNEDPMQVDLAEEDEAQQGQSEAMPEL